MDIKSKLLDMINDRDSALTLNLGPSHLKSWYNDGLGLNSNKHNGFLEPKHYSELKY